LWFFRNFFLVCICLSLSLSVCLSVASFIAISTSHPFLFNFLLLIHPPILPTSVRFEVLMMVRYLWGWRQEILLREDVTYLPRLHGVRPNKSPNFPRLAYCWLFSPLFCLLGFY
jgi:hypothetical protein